MGTGQTRPDAEQPSLLAGDAGPGTSATPTPSQHSPAPVAPESPVSERSLPTPATEPAKPTGDPSTPARGGATSHKVNCAKAKCIALTFDDGPAPETKALLDLLAEKQVRATFFVIGARAAEYPGTLRRMVAEGHVVGNHTYNHADLAKLSADGVRRELTRGNAAIARAIGGSPRLMRPPFGSSNATVRRVARDLGLTPVLWSVDPLDWSDRDAGVVARRVVARAAPGGIILSHDIYPSTRKAYARIIDRLRAKGFVFVTVPDLVGGRLKPGVTLSQR